MCNCVYMCVRCACILILWHCHYMTLSYIYIRRAMVFSGCCHCLPACLCTRFQTELFCSVGPIYAWDSIMCGACQTRILCTNKHNIRHWHRQNRIIFQNETDTYPGRTKCTLCKKKHTHTHHASPTTMTIDRSRDEWRWNSKQPTTAKFEHLGKLVGLFLPAVVDYSVFCISRLTWSPFHSIQMSKIKFAFLVCLFCTSALVLHEHAPCALCARFYEYISRDTSCISQISNSSNRVNYNSADSIYEYAWRTCCVCSI